MARRLALLLGLAFILAGCADERTSSRAQALRMAAPSSAPMPAVAATAGATDQSAALDAMTAARKLVRTAEIDVEVASFAVAADEVERAAEAQGGYLADSSAARAPGSPQQGSLTIRVPAEHFGATMKALRQVGTVRAETVHSQDVSRDYADLESRIRVQRDAEARMREIMTKGTGKISDVIEAEGQLTAVVAEAERLEGQRRYYDQVTALSTITAQLSEPSNKVAVAGPAWWTPIRDGFDEGRKALVMTLAAATWLVMTLGVWLLLVALTVMLVRRVQASRAPAPATTPR